MKKILSSILAVAMVASMSSVAFAADITANNGSDASDVNAMYVAGSSASTIYSVDVTWGSMVFTYTGADEGTWNPETHVYDGAGDAATWSGDGAGTVTVANHSNTGVSVAFAYAKTVDTVTGSFSKESFDLATAVGTEVGAAPSNSTELTLSGTLDDSYTASTKVGSVTVTIS